ncbi:expressed unknown protein [Seminavis robusta]|uniref:Uncharacterized protein n=1 Tax=Seminavis robusta TaxID=568900 RepID=A0A9N8F4W9_9STRA|nr:expressed unknown protein [Seminavis robusta]|eukprot:Sro3107_g343880.1 n/a (68) ;mRNA; f:8804-9086
MKASRQDVSPSLPKVPIARLVGHDGPIQQVQFAAIVCMEPIDDTYLALGQKETLLTTTDVQYSFTLT